MKVAAYCRVSTDSADQLNSLENQKSYFTREIVDKGHELYKIYYDEGLTGTRLNNRRGFEKLLNDAGVDIVVHRSNKRDKRITRSHTFFEASSRLPLFDAIWIKNTSRFARNTLSYEIIQVLRQKNVNIFFVEQSINTNEVGQDLLLKLFQVFDEQESKDKSLKVRTGINEGIKKGVIHTNNKLFGYSYIKDENRLEIIEEEAVVVRLIFALYLEGKGIRQIISHLTENKIYAKYGRPFVKTTVRNIINNEKYAGLNNPLKYDTGWVLNKNSYAKVRDEYETYEYESKIPRIIDVETFNKCQEIMRSKINYQNQIGLYKGISKYCNLIYCGKCGSVYHSNSDRGRNFYNCSKRKRFGKNVCDNPNVSEKAIDEYIQLLADGRIKELIDGDARFVRNTIFSEIKLKFREINLDRQDEIRVLQNQLDKSNGALSRLYDLYSRDDSQQEMLLKKIDELQKEIKELAELKNHLSRDNRRIYSEIKTLYAIYQESMELLDTRKEEYSVDEVLSILRKIYITYDRYMGRGLKITGFIAIRDNFYELLKKNGLQPMQFTNFTTDEIPVALMDFSDVMVEELVKKIESINE